MKLRVKDICKEKGIMLKDLADKIRKYQEDLVNNQTAQKSQQQQIENQKKILEALKLKRKG